MPIFRSKWSWCLLGLTLLVGCERDRATPTAQTPARALQAVPQLLFHQPLPLQRVELASEALAVWRQHAARKPTLLLLSDLPMLLPVPEAIREQADRLASTASGPQIYRQSYPKSPELLLLPDMTVDTALRLGWLGELAWVLPLRDPQQPLNLEGFRRQLLDRGLVTSAEAESLTAAANGIQGRLRQTPFRAATLAQQQRLPAPLLVHVDLSYFQALYKNEVATPLLDLVIQTVGDLRALELPVLAVTFSYGNLDDRIALDVRFVGDFLARLSAEPEMFDQPLPLPFARQSELLYLANFFQKEKIRELALAQEQDMPDAAWVKFNLFRSAVEHKEGGLALDYLARAVALDRAYALEYLDLARFAHDQGRADEALRMLELASQALPEDPVIRLQMAQLAEELGERERARSLVAQLLALPWSPVYFADLQDYLSGFKTYLETARPGPTVQTPHFHFPSRPDLP